MVRGRFEELAAGGERARSYACCTGTPGLVLFHAWWGLNDDVIAYADRPLVLGHFAENDPYEPDETVVVFERALRDAGRRVVIHRYPETGHWFAEPSRDAWQAEAAELAFERTVTFLREHLETGGPAE